MSFKFLRGSTDYDLENIHWRTYHGRHIPVTWMTNSHIHNCLLCLKGQGLSEIPNPYMGRTREEWIYIFERVLIVRTRGLEEF